MLRILWLKAQYTFVNVRTRLILFASEPCTSQERENPVEVARNAIENNKKSFTSIVALYNDVTHAIPWPYFLQLYSLLN